MAPPVFKTGLAGITPAGRFDSFPPPPRLLATRSDYLSERAHVTLDFGSLFRSQHRRVPRVLFHVVHRDIGALGL